MRGNVKHQFQILPEGKKTSDCTCTVYRITSQSKQGGTENTELRLTELKPFRGAAKPLLVRTAGVGRQHWFPRETAECRTSLWLCDSAAGILATPAPSLPMTPVFPEEKRPRTPRQHPRNAELGDKTFSATKFFFQNCTNVEQNFVLCPFTTRTSHGAPSTYSPIPLAPGTLHS